MERITDKINALPDGANYFSLEFFPPKTAMVCLPRCAQAMEC
jgi:methylenetetrahydrofolate reductase (NADPH)